MGIDRDAAVKKADDLARQGKIDLAIDEYRRLVEETPGDYSAGNALGDLYAKSGDKRMAVAQFAQLGDAHKDTGFVPKAIAFYKKALRLDPSSDHALWQLAQIAVAQELYADATLYLNRLLQRRRDEGNEPGVAECLVLLGGFPSATADAKLAAATAAAGHYTASQTAHLWMDAADALERHGRRAEALDVLMQAAALDREDLALRTRIALTCVETGQVDRAHAFLSLEVAGGHPDLLLAFAKHELSAGRDDTAREALLRFVSVAPERTAEAEPFLAPLTGGVTVGDPAAEDATSGGIESAVAPAPEADAAGGTWFSTSAPEVQALFVPTTPPAGDTPPDTHTSLLTETPADVVGPSLDAVAALLADPPEEAPVAVSAIEPTPEAPAAQPARPSTMKSDDWAAMFEDGGDDHHLDLDTPSDGSTGGAAAPAAEHDIEPPSVEPVAESAPAEPVLGATSDEPAAEPAAEPAIVIESLVEPVEAPPVVAPPVATAPIARPSPPPAPVAPPAPAPPRIDPPRAAAPQVPPPIAPRPASEPAAATDTDQVAAALEAAAQNPALQFQASAELGRLYLRRGRLQEGIEWLERAARAQAPVRDHGLAVQYELGDALERSGEPARALDVFADLDLDAASYRDVQERMARLRQALGEPPGR